MRAEALLLVGGWLSLAIAFFSGLFAIWTTGTTQSHFGGSAALFGCTGLVLLLGYFFAYKL